MDSTNFTPPRIILTLPKRQYTEQQIENQFTEYHEILLSLELCVKLAEKHKESPNTKLRACARVVLERVKDPVIEKILRGIVASVFPTGVLSRLRRELDESTGE